VNIAHEMLHRWLGLTVRLEVPEGAGFWFTEGFTVHYATTLMLRAGLLTPDEVLSELNDLAVRHFANPFAAATNDEIRRGFFENDQLSVLPYTRGALYAAELDGALRKASKGARSLDDLMRELYASALATPENEVGLRELPAGALRSLVERELGPDGARRFDAVIEGGADPEPPSSSYGPCFTRVPTEVARYQLGFDEPRSQHERAIRGLIAGSAADNAGLREGDELISLDAANLLPTREATAVVRRNGQPVTVRYFPAGAPKRAAFSWQRAAGVPDGRCRAREP
jgi:predicted metalloprotease with PDZ domain